MPEYPPEPWRLAGQAYLSAWRVPATELPAVPEGIRPRTVAGQAFVITAWIDYQEGGQLAYHELLATVAVHGRARPTGSITEIWVDSEVSLAGGRALWSIPKDMAVLDFRHGSVFTGSAATRETWIATAAFTSRLGPPIALPARFGIAQRLDAGVRHSPVRGRARPRPASASWNINPNGPLGYLAGHDPVCSLHLKDFTLLFGATSREPVR